MFAIYIKTLAGGFEIMVNPDTTIGELKGLINQHESSYRKELQTLIDFRDTSQHIVLSDENTMAGFSGGDEINVWVNQLYYFPPIQKVLYKMKEYSLKGIQLLEKEFGLERGKEYRFLLHSYDYIPVSVEHVRVVYESRQGTYSHTANPFFYPFFEPYNLGQRYELIPGDICIGTFVKATDTHCTTYDEHTGMVRLVMAFVLNNCSVYRNGDKIEVKGMKPSNCIYIQVQYITCEN